MCHAYTMSQYTDERESDREKKSKKEKQDEREGY